MYDYIHKNSYKEQIMRYDLYLLIINEIEEQYL